MGKEFTIIKELATISATITELVAIDRIIKHEIPSTDFRTDYVSLISDMHNTYQGVVTILEPLTQALTADSFAEHFEQLQPWYSDGYQSIHSASRINAEFTFEKYLQFRKRKEVNTKYPPLKAAFSRLHDYIDKWIDNDIWLSLSIDTALKMLNQKLTEVSKMKVVDEEEAYNYYYSCVAGLEAYVLMLSENIKLLAGSLESEEMKKAV